MSAGFEIGPLSESPGFLGTITRWVSETWEETTKAALGARLSDNAGCPPTLVAVSDGDLVGVVAFTRSTTDGRELEDLWLNVVYVDEAWRGQGAGSRLVAAALDGARGEGYGRLFVYTGVPGFYEGSGWVREARDGIEPGDAVLRVDL